MLQTSTHPTPSARPTASVRRGLVFLLLGATPLVSVAAQRSPDPRSSLELFTLRAGEPWDISRERLDSLPSRVECRASIDPRITECRGTVALAGSPVPFDLVISLVSGHTAIILLSGRTSHEVISGWITELGARHGQPTVRTTQGQQTWQWIRRRQMLRLSTRPGRGRPEVALSLIDGPLLDGLDRATR